MTTFTETRIVLQYGKAGDVQKHSPPRLGMEGYTLYVHPVEAEMFVDLDSASGGYPTVAESALTAYDFKTVARAKAYAASEGFHVRKLTITCEASEPSQSD